MNKHLSEIKAFSLIEVISVILVIGIIAAVVISRGNSNQYNLYTQTEFFMGHLRYAQTRAMNDSLNVGLNIWGIKCDGTYYWLFRGTDPNSNIFLLPDGGNYANSNRKQDLSLKNISMSAFVIFFDERGIPYSAYTSSSSNIPITSDMSITVTSGSSTRKVTITPETGFVQVQ